MVFIEDDLAVVTTTQFSLESVTVGADATKFGDIVVERSSNALAQDIVEEVSSLVAVWAKMIVLNTHNQRWTHDGNQASQ